MATAIIITFVIGYLLIALEHPIHIDKAATALLTGVVCWSIYMFGLDSLIPEGSIPHWFADKIGHHGDHGAYTHTFMTEWAVEGQLAHSLAEIAGILFFLMGAMTIVELVDAYEGFSIITDRINAKSQVTLLWVVAILTFFMSSVLDNLTTTIVMVSLLRKLIKDHDRRLFYAGMVVIAANAGGAWTVIGDVTTTMLWIKKKITPVPVGLWLFLPSLACLCVPLFFVSRYLKGPVERPEHVSHAHYKKLKPYQSMLFLCLGFGGLLFVPVFKAVTHLPPFMGVMFSLSIMWIVSEIIKHDMDQETRSSTHVLAILKKIDTGSILFFLGILLAVNSLASVGILKQAAEGLDTYVGNKNAIAILIGLLSAVVDNVPLVAAGIEMYDMPTDNLFWIFLAYCAGTGGSCLIIGSAAGVAAMGLERIDFMWYVKKVSFWALLGYLAGCGVYFAQIWIVSSLGYLN
jgi:Na+/H+ antiporter NhaD/arsenite permease-like protein